MQPFKYNGSSTASLEFIWLFRFDNEKGQRQKPLAGKFMVVATGFEPVTPAV